MKFSRVTNLLDRITVTVKDAGVGKAGAATPHVDEQRAECSTTTRKTMRSAQALCFLI
jgi:hypothetical protein